MTVIVKSLALSASLATLLAACASPVSPPEITQCQEPRPQMCTMQYDPVCATDRGGVQRTMASDCSACGDRRVVGYTLGECAAAQP